MLAESHTQSILPVKAPCPWTPPQKGPCPLDSAYLCPAPTPIKDWLSNPSTCDVELGGVKFLKQTVQFTESVAQDTTGRGERRRHRGHSLWGPGLADCAKGQEET